MGVEAGVMLDVVRSGFKPVMVDWLKDKWVSVFQMDSSHKSLVRAFLKVMKWSPGYGKLDNEYPSHQSEAAQ